MAAKNLTNAIAALRAQVRARHCADKTALAQATADVKCQAPFTHQVQQALIGNTERMNLSNVTPTWVKRRNKECKPKDNVILSRSERHE